MNTQDELTQTRAKLKASVERETKLKERILVFKTALRAIAANTAPEPRDKKD